VSSYYYLIASLPGLPEEGAPPLAREPFLRLCAEQLHARDHAELEAVLAGGGSSRFAARRAAFDLRLRNACARERARRRGLAAEPFLRPDRGIDLGLERAVAAAFAADDPLARERALERLRVADLRAAAYAEPFGLPAVLAYALELEMLQHRAERTGEAGRAALLRCVEGVLAKAAERRRTEAEEAR
jgi:hypothetical protein